MCGEQISAICILRAREGSPPRVRGTDHCASALIHVVRITPACAGNRHFSVFINEEIRDHPRVCGEQKHLHSKIQRPGGSPPRVRGTGSQCDLHIPSYRITPACAGNSVRSQLWPYAHEDHPRVCGEQLTRCATSFRRKGSPPRVRGTAFRYSRGRRGAGITPACAGNSMSVLGGLKDLKDHPRVCGEQFSFYKTI